jgi:hypothetical protein
VNGVDLTIHARVGQTVTNKTASMNSVLCVLLLQSHTPSMSSSTTLTRDCQLGTSFNAIILLLTLHMSIPASQVSRDIKRWVIVKFPHLNYIANNARKREREFCDFSGFFSRRFAQFFALFSRIRGRVSRESVLSFTNSAKNRGIRVRFRSFFVVLTHYSRWFRCANKKVFGSLLNMPTVKAGSRNQAGKLFQTVGPLTAKARGPKVTVLCSLIYS